MSYDDLRGHLRRTVTQSESTRIVSLDDTQLFNSFQKVETGIKGHQQVGVGEVVHHHFDKVVWAYSIVPYIDPRTKSAIGPDDKASRLSVEVEH